MLFVLCTSGMSLLSELFGRTLNVYISVSGGGFDGSVRLHLPGIEVWLPLPQ